MQFEGQHEDEEVLFFFRQHPVVLRKPLLVLLVIFAVSLLPLSFDPLSQILQVVALSGFVIGLVIFFYFWVIWYFSLYIVTDLRVIQDKRQGLFGKQVVEVDLDKIQSVNYEVPGFQASIFKFGTIVVQTYVGDLVIEKVHQPAEIHKQLTGILRNIESDEIIE